MKFTANTTITLRRSSGVSATLPALVTEEHHRDDGALHSGSGCRLTLRLAPEAQPTLGDTFLCGGRLYQIRSLKLCRDVRGRAAAWYCTTK